MKMSISRTLRQEALNQAVTLAQGESRTSEEIVNQAEKFYEFLIVAETKEDEENG